MRPLRFLRIFLFLRRYVSTGFARTRQVFFRENSIRSKRVSNCRVPTSVYGSKGTGFESLGELIKNTFYFDLIQTSKF